MEKFGQLVTLQSYCSLARLAAFTALEAQSYLRAIVKSLTQDFGPYCSTLSCFIVANRLCAQLVGLCRWSIYNRIVARQFLLLPRSFNYSSIVNLTMLYLERTVLRIYCTIREI